MPSPLLSFIPRALQVIRVLLTPDRVLMITSALHRRWTGDVEISDLVEAGLPVPSIVRPVKITTIEEKDAEAAGRLPMADRKAVMRCLSAALRDAGTAG